MNTEHLAMNSMNEVETLLQRGIITQSQHDAYCYMWENSAFRYNVKTTKKFLDLDHDVKIDVWKIYSKSPTKTKTKISFLIRKEISLQEGCIFDSARGQYIGQAVIELAELCGMTIEDERTPEHEFYFEAWDDAENWLNSHIATQGFYFGSNESGDFGYWRTDNYVYIVDLDERGEYKAHVEHEAQDGHGMIVLDVPELVNDGFMKNTEDMGGLLSYLQDVKLLPHDAELTTL